MTHPTTTAELALHVLSEQASAFVEHVPQARPGADPEHVHISRVATRRLRAALRVFEDVLPRELEGMHDELGWIASQLGPVRDLDVQARRLGACADELGLWPAVQPYAEWLADRRQDAQVAFDAAFQSERCAALLERLRGLCRVPEAAVDGEAAASLEADAPIDKDAPRRLRRAHRKLRKRAEDLSASSSPLEFHRARISAKRLRYTAEFFEALYGRPARRLIDCCVDVQDLLGDQQDGVVNRQHIQEAVRQTRWPAATLVALGQLIHWEAQHAQELRHDFSGAYKDITEAWRRLRQSF